MGQKVTKRPSEEIEEVENFEEEEEEELDPEDDSGESTDDSETPEENTGEEEDVEPILFDYNGRKMTYDEVQREMGIKEQLIQQREREIARHQQMMGSQPSPPRQDQVQVSKKEQEEAERLLYDRDIDLIAEKLGPRFEQVAGANQQYLRMADERAIQEAELWLMEEQAANDRAYSDDAIQLAAMQVKNYHPDLKFRAFKQRLLQITAEEKKTRADNRMTMKKAEAKAKKKLESQLPDGKGTAAKKSRKFMTDDEAEKKALEHLEGNW